MTDSKQSKPLSPDAEWPDGDPAMELAAPCRITVERDVKAEQWYGSKWCATCEQTWPRELPVECPRAVTSS